MAAIVLYSLFANWCGGTFDAFGCHLGFCWVSNVFLCVWVGSLQENPPLIYPLVYVRQLADSQNYRIRTTVYRRSLDVCNSASTYICKCVQHNPLLLMWIVRQGQFGCFAGELVSVLEMYVFLWCVLPFYVHITAKASYKLGWLLFFVYVVFPTTTNGD